jgi:hypothetical protein
VLVVAVGRFAVYGDAVFVNVADTASRQEAVGRAEAIWKIGAT